MNNKKMTRKQAEKLLTSPNSLQKTEEANKIQKIAERREEPMVPSDIWIISDSSSTFPSLFVKNG
jgi:hypothetical protein